MVTTQRQPFASSSLGASWIYWLWPLPNLPSPELSENLSNRRSRNSEVRLFGAVISYFTFSHVWDKFTRIPRLWKPLNRMDMARSISLTRTVSEKYINSIYKYIEGVAIIYLAAYVFADKHQIISKLRSWTLYCFGHAQILELCGAITEICEYLRNHLK